jgi:hypothetical protein
MRKLLFLTVVLLFCSSATLAQTPTEEIQRLQELLGVSEQTKIKPATNLTLQTTDKPLKIYIATGLDMKVRENFLRWIEKWNKSGDVKKYGSLEVVSDISEADIVLARYTLNENARTETASRPSVGTVYDPATNKVISRPTQQTYSYSTVPVFAYVLRRNDKDFEILSRYNDSADLGEYKNTGELLWDNFKKLLKSKK